MKQSTFNLWFLITQIIIGIFAGFFAWQQWKINKRAQRREGYVVLAISPAPPSSIILTNAGRLNLYMHKWEIGHLSNTFVKPWLLAMEQKSSIAISLGSEDLNRFMDQGQCLIKIYLEDDEGRKFITTGEIAVTNIGLQTSLPVPPQQPPENENQATLPAQATFVTNANVLVGIRAWAYKTEREDWAI